MPRSARKIKSVPKVKKSVRKVKKSVRKTKKNVPKVKKNVRKNRSYRLGFSKYDSHQVDVIMDRIPPFTFYTDCKTDSINDVKKELLKMDLAFFRQKRVTLDMIHLSQEPGGNDFENEHIISEPLTLYVTISLPLLGVFRINRASQPVGNCFLPTQQQEEAYGHAIDNYRDGDGYLHYGDYKYMSGVVPGGYIFTSDNESFFIVNQKSNRSGGLYGSKTEELHTKHKNWKWYTTSVYEDYTESTQEESRICRFYDYIPITPTGQHTLQDVSVNVDGNTHQFMDVSYREIMGAGVFSYTRLDGTKAFVIGDYNFSKIPQIMRLVTERTWHTIPSPYNSRYDSDKDASRIYRSYPSIDRVYQRIIQDVTITADNGDRGYTFKSVKYIPIDGIDTQVLVFSYISSRGTITFVIGIPNDLRLTIGDIFGKIDDVEKQRKM